MLTAEMVFEPSPSPIWSSPLPVLQLSTSSSGLRSSTSAVQRRIPQQSQAHAPAAVLAVRTLAAVHFFSMQHALARAAAEAGDHAVALRELDVVHPHDTARRRIVDVQMCPGDPALAAIVDDSGAVWSWSFAPSRGRNL